MIRICLLTSIFTIFLINPTIGQPNHIKSFNNKGFNAVDFEIEGCRTKNGGAILKGGLYACQSSKPLKPKNVLKSSKTLCGNNFSICHENDKPIQKLSKKESKVPNGCFAFKSRGSKLKAAGYGKDCSNNLYYVGVLCCPNHEKKFPIFPKAADEKATFLKNNGLHGLSK